MGFHAFPYLVSGGFVGVDVFFVISGYLISNIIMVDLKEGRFDIATFYRRRVKRIFPSLVVVLIVVYLLGWLILLPNEFKQLGWHMLGGSLFVANFVLPDSPTDHYFSSESTVKPLLNLWSLSVEWQFYLGYPFIIWLLWKRGSGMVAELCMAATVSFGLLVHFQSGNTFYYSPATRFFEFLAGCVLSLPGSQTRSFAENNLKSIIGFLMIVVGAFLIHKKQILMAWWLLVPVMGAVLVLSAGQYAWINRVLLSNRVIVWFGVISYPLYLWHWPILAFQKILAGDTPSRLARIMACLLSVLLAWMTYRFVEVPFRFNSAIKYKHGLLVSVLFLVGVAGLITDVNDGFWSRNPARIEHHGELSSDAVFEHMADNAQSCTPKNIYYNSESLSFGRRGEQLKRCFQSKDKPIGMALVGDSHAEHLFIGLSEHPELPGVVYYTKPGPPVFSNGEYSDIFMFLYRDPDIKHIILAATWQSQLSRLVAEKKRPVDEIQKTVDYLRAAGKKVFLVEDVPFFSFHPVSCKFSRNLFPMSLCSERHKGLIVDHDIRESDPFEAVVENLKEVTVIRTKKYFCDQERCSMAKDDQLLFFDWHHLNINGSRFLANEMVKSLNCSIKNCDGEIGR
ncbi:MAG: acyltransferase [Magnetococcus sp. YQC-5]